VARKRGDAARVDDLEAPAVCPRRGHQVRARRRLASFVANLTDAHVRRLRPRGLGRRNQPEQDAADCNQPNTGRKAKAGMQDGFSVPALNRIKSV
jgi:hypothetical protein